MYSHVVTDYIADGAWNEPWYVGECRSVFRYHISIILSLILTLAMLGMTAAVLPSSMSDCVSSHHPGIHPGMSMYQSHSGMMSPHHLPHHHPHHPHGPPMPLSDADTDPRELGLVYCYIDNSIFLLLSSDYHECNYNDITDRVFRSLCWEIQAEENKAGSDASWCWQSSRKPQVAWCRSSVSEHHL